MRLSFKALRVHDLEGVALARRQSENSFIEASLSIAEKEVILSLSEMRDLSCFCFLSPAAIILAKSYP